MNDLLRPALYQAVQQIVPVQRRDDGELQQWDIVGPVCETGDFLGKGRSLALAAGDLLAVRSSGAYGFTMSSNYNSRPRAAEVMVDGGEVHLVRRRETLADLFASARRRCPGNIMKRRLEPELMDTEEQALAYARADFTESNTLFMRLLEEQQPGELIGARALDLGCGPADIVIRFLRRYTKARCDALDGSRPMLDLAQADIDALPGIAKRARLLCDLLPSRPWSLRPTT
jgi:hypothetical protein